MSKCSGQPAVHRCRFRSVRHFCRQRLLHLPAVFLHMTGPSIIKTILIPIILKIVAALEHPVTLLLGCNIFLIQYGYILLFSIDHCKQDISRFYFPDAVDRLNLANQRRIQRIVF